MEDLIPTCLCVRAKYLLDDEQKEKDIFFFEHGAVVFWNFPPLERDAVMNLLKSVEVESYQSRVIYEESEMMTYLMSPEGTSLKWGIMLVIISRKFSPTSIFISEKAQFT